MFYNHKNKMEAEFYFHYIKNQLRGSGKLKISLNRFSKFIFFSLSALILLPININAQDNSDCLMCHSDNTLTGTKNGRSFSVYVNEKKYKWEIESFTSRF